MITFTSIASSSKGNAYLVEAPDAAPLLLEAGLPIKQLRIALYSHMNGGIASLAGCLVSHEHGDHSKAVKDLLKAGVDCWMSLGTAEALGVSEHHRTNILTAGQQVKIKRWTILPFNLAHDVPTLGYVISDGEDRLLFIPDTSYIHNRFEGINVLVVEVNHIESMLADNIASGAVDADLGKRIRRNHLSLEVVKDFIRANNFRQIREAYAIHLSNANSDEVRIKRELQELIGVPVYVA